MTNRIFFRHIGIHFMCYSSNIHLDDKAEPDIWNFNSSRRGARNVINYFNLQMPASESLSYWDPPVVRFSVHSPFIQDDPSISSNELLLGHIYEINIRLEVEHLLPHPFPTNCTNYNEMWRKNNKTGPRSQEVCQNKCLDHFKERCWEYLVARTLNENNDSYMQEYSSCKKMDFEEIPSCEANCRANCVYVTISIVIF
ncbi:uncharacterized protein NPIL_146841 [Nephila pilipes]|uniref:Uncharacterized protein n=1 Tax=Nephila pilipes TaxID=299642 RepID=A0A8X6QCW0_NEPPI|nr:uncharacterized protein NPIL_146841 [Nephila pilipes]